MNYIYITCFVFVSIKLSTPVECLPDDVFKSGPKVLKEIPKVMHDTVSVSKVKNLVANYKEFYKHVQQYYIALETLDLEIVRSYKEILRLHG